MIKTSISPHIHAQTSIKRTMWNVNIALIPALAGSIYFFGMRAFWLVFISTITAVLTEILMQILFKKKITVSDGSAVVTGILVGFNMPPGIPFYVPLVATIFAIAVVKHLFGGLGNNIFNPALAGRVFVMFAWTVDMTTWNLPLDPQWFHHFNLFQFKIDSVTAATPLAINKLEGFPAVINSFTNIFNNSLAVIQNQTNTGITNVTNLITKSYIYKQLFIGNVGGCLGETSGLAILIGAVYLSIRKILKPLIPLIYILTVFIITSLAGQDPVFHILAGGLFLGAFFMATDYVTCPFTKTGLIIYAVGCGLITSLLRLKGGLPEGVSFSILLMNGLTPLIDRYTKTKVYGRGKR